MVVVVGGSQVWRRRWERAAVMSLPPTWCTGHHPSVELHAASAELQRVNTELQNQNQELVRPAHQTTDFSEDRQALLNGHSGTPRALSYHPSHITHVSSSLL